jgi:glycosyltransferase involved in cell wall biosynthesis
VIHIDQIIPGAAPGDAVTESALCIRDALRGVVESDIYAIHVHPRMFGTVGWVDQFPSSEHRTRRDIIIQHVSMASRRLTDLVTQRRERLLLVYHNITPASFFDIIDPEFAADLDDGRRQLPRLLARADRVLADSDVNAAELRALGRLDVRVVPPPLNVNRLLDVSPDPETIKAISERGPGKMVLFVGQLLPHKRPDLLIGAHHLLNANYFPDAQLVLAGSARNDRYYSALKRYVADINLETAWLVPDLNDAQLAAFFRRADVFATASEHEGFCVPLVEAFSFDVPVIARDFGAVRHTAGDAALVLPADGGARDVAEAIRCVLQDDVLSRELVNRGRTRRERFQLDRTLPPILSVIRDLVQSTR